MYGPCQKRWNQMWRGSTMKLQRYACTWERCDMPRVTNSLFSTCSIKARDGEPCLPTTAKIAICCISVSKHHSEDWERRLTIRKVIQDRARVVDCEVITHSEYSYSPNKGESWESRSTILEVPFTWLYFMIGVSTQNHRGKAEYTS